MRHDRSKRLSHEDRLDIQDLIIGYAALLDLQSFDELAGLFTASGVMEFPEVRLLGPSQIAAHLQSAAAQSSYPRRMRHVSSIWLSGRGWDCVARSHYFETSWDPNRRQAVLLTAGMFEDLIVHIGHEWRFSSRRFESLDPSKSHPAAVPALMG